MNGTVLAAIKARLTLSSSNTSQPEGTTTSYDRIVIQLLKRYATDAIITKGDDNIPNFKQGL